MAGCAIMAQDFFSVAPQYDLSLYFDAEPEDAPQIASDLYDVCTPAAFEAEAIAAVEDEPTAYVDDLMYCAFATPFQLCEFAEDTIAGFRSCARSSRHHDYVERFEAVARVALELAHPLTYAAFVAGDVSDEAREIIGAALKRRLRPAHMVFKAQKCRPRKQHSTVF
jgi:hypothetical protein